MSAEPPPGDASSAGGPSTDESSEPRGFRLRGWHLASFVLLLAVGGLLLYGFWPMLVGEEEAEEDRPEVEEVDDAAARIDAVVAKRTSFPLRTEATGRLAPWTRTTVSAEAGGLVRERLVEEGDRVEEGDLLVRLDDRDAQIELAEAEAELTEARVEYAVNTQEDNPPVSETPDTTAVVEAREELREAEEAFDRGEMTQRELEQARRAYESARVRAGLDREAVQAATAGLTQAEQRVERARLELDRSRVEAPFAGRVANLEVETGQNVGAGEEVLTLLDDRPMKVTIDVLEEDLVRIQEGASVQIDVPALGAAAPDDELVPARPTIDGEVYAINPLVDPETGTGRITVTVPNPDDRLGAGLFATVRLETDRLEDRLVVPADAVLVRQGRDLVFVIENGRAQWEYVEVGARSGDYVEIIDGVSPGDTVAVDGHFALAHDAPVEVDAVRDVEVP